MTTIVYRDRVMAADTRATAGDWVLPDKCAKLRKLVDGRLVGFSGNYNMIEPFIDWLLKSNGDTQPDLKEELTVLLVGPYGKPVLKYQQQGRFEINAPFVVIGSGIPPALGALYAGASARDAVRIASLIDPFTGGDVESIELDRP